LALVTGMKLSGSGSVHMQNMINSYHRLQDDSRKISALPTAFPGTTRQRYEGEKPALHPAFLIMRRSYCESIRFND
jgi:hypothetical protein